MAKRKVKGVEFYSGDITREMLALWMAASMPDAHELRLQISTMQFYNKASVGDGLLVVGTNALVVTKEMADEYFGSK